MARLRPIDRETVLCARARPTCGPVTDASLNPGPFDAVPVSDLIQPLAPAPERMNSLVARQLIPGGVFLVLTFPNCGVPRRETSGT